MEIKTDSFVYRVTYGNPFEYPPKSHPPTNIWRLRGRFLLKLLLVWPLLWLLAGIIIVIMCGSLILVAKWPYWEYSDTRKLSHDINGWPTIFGHRIYPIVIVAIGLIIWGGVLYPLTALFASSLFIGVCIGIGIVRLAQRYKDKICPTVTFVNSETENRRGCDSC